MNNRDKSIKIENKTRSGTVYVIRIFQIICALTLINNNEFYIGEIKWLKKLLGR
jgi:hypothetical protein